jgi:hypothetical protein
MDAGVWEEEFAEARQRLLESGEVCVLLDRGHDLKNAVVLTSVSDVPFEVGLKCSHCGLMFWFENAQWSTGGAVEWHMSSISVREANFICGVQA